jgi:hypothetical protein
MSKPGPAGSRVDGSEVGTGHAEKRGEKPVLKKVAINARSFARVGGVDLRYNNTQVLNMLKV